MQKYLKTLEKEITKFQSTIKENQNKLKFNEDILQKASQEFNNLSERLEVIKAEKNKLESQRIAKIKQRQEILYNGENPKEITAEISRIKEELEIKEDESIAVQKRVDEYTQDISDWTSVISNLKSENQDLTDKIKCYKYCIEYNTAAKTFLDIYKNVKDMKYIVTHPHVSIPSKIHIPFLYASGQTPEFFGDRIDGYYGGDVENPIIHKNAPINFGLFYSELEKAAVYNEKTRVNNDSSGVKVSYSYKR